MFGTGAEFESVGQLQPVTGAALACGCDDVFSDDETGGGQGGDETGGLLGSNACATGIAPEEAAAPTMALTWAMACNDQQKRPKAPEGLPWLFAADLDLPPEQGWHWSMYCGHEPCAQPDHCVHHDLLPRLPDAIPHQIHFGTRPPHRLADKSDALFAPGTSAPSSFGTPC